MSELVNIELLAELCERDQWLLWGASSEEPRRPHWRGDVDISWSNPDDWHSFDEAVAAAAERDSWGIGYVFAVDNPRFDGGKYGFIDPDGCLREPRAEKPKDWVPPLDEFLSGYVEYSAGQFGLHIPFEGSVPDWWTNPTGDEHEGPEAHGNKFCAFTGDVLDSCEPSNGVVCDDPAPFLLAAYEAWHGEYPPLPDLSDTTDESPDERGEYEGDEYLTDEDIEDALSHLDPDMPMHEWWNIGRAIQDYDDGATGKRLYTEWSKTGDKWDDQAPELRDWVWEQSDPGTQTTLGTLIYQARNAGWTMPPSPESKAKGGGTGARGGDTAATDGGAISATAGTSDAGLAAERDAGESPLVDLFRAVIRARGLKPAWIHGPQDDPESVQSVVGPAGTIGEAIMRYRRRSDQHGAADTKRVIAAVTTHDLRAQGRILAPRGESPYYFYEPEHRVYRLDEGRFHGLLEERYDLADDTEGKLVLSRIERLAPRVGERVEVYRVGYWDDEGGTLCVHDRDGGYYAVTADGIERRHNGANGVFFLPVEDADPIRYVDSGERDGTVGESGDPSELDLPGELPGADESIDAYRRILVNRANVTAGGGLTKTDQRTLLDLYLHALPFMNRIPEKPILAFSGVKESGKTASMRAIGQFINGTQWDVRIHADEEDFWAAVSNNAVVAYDQLDSQPPWLNDGLAAVATGTQYTLRKLYTTNEEATYRPRCWLAVNSRDPKFTRDDVASRLLIMQFEQLDAKFGRRAFLAPLYDHYDELWSQYLDRLQGIVAALAGRDEPPASSAFRMADWADLVTTAAEPLGYETAEVEAVIDRLKDQQAHFALESEPAFEALKSLMRDGGDGESYTASELAEALQSAANDRGIPFNRSGARSVGRWIAHHRPELETTVGLVVVDNGTKPNEYRLPATGQQSIDG